MISKRGLCPKLCKRIWRERDGVLYWRETGKGRGKGPIGSKTQSGHLQVRYNYLTYYAHAIVYAIHKGVWPSMVDHKDRNPANNIDNLRLCTHSSNMANATSAKDIPGVTMRPSGNWYAHMYIQGKQLLSATFTNKFDAICARKSLENMYVGNI